MRRRLGRGGCRRSISLDVGVGRAVHRRSGGAGQEPLEENQSPGGLGGGTPNMEGRAGGGELWGWTGKHVWGEAAKAGGEPEIKPHHSPVEGCPLPGCSEKTEAQGSRHWRLLSPRKSPSPAIVTASQLCCETGQRRVSSQMVATSQRGLVSGHGAQATTFPELLPPTWRPLRTGRWALSPLRAQGCMDGAGGSEGRRPHPILLCPDPSLPDPH